MTLMSDAKCDDTLKDLILSLVIAQLRYTTLQKFEVTNILFLLFSKEPFK